MREFDQRIAVVSKEDLGKGRWGLWVELKTKDARGATRIERGLFAPASLRGSDLLPGGDGSDLGGVAGAGDAPGDDDTASNDDARGGDFVLVRYQTMSGAKLYEYPVGTSRHARLGGDVSTFELFEYDPSVRPIQSTVGPDTLRLGRRVVPAMVERVRRYGSDRWPSNDDSTGIERLVLTQTIWRNGVVPVTGFARSIFQAEMRRLPWSSRSDSLLSGVAFASRPDSTMLAEARAVGAQADSLLRADMDAAALRPDSSGVFTPAPSRTLLAWTELTLTDLGSDAKPEITQQPELPPDLEETETDPTGFQR
ncbi:MAG TPA: hypothetical protein VFU59_07945 [Candidatus Eisenbacteria bacterium]|nr:hypothetical protein [Candidatus Eisenbacteria bacterium]